MKNPFIILLMLILGAQTLSAQVFVNKVNINERNLEYLEVWEKRNKDKNTYVGMIDYGQMDDRVEDKAGLNLIVTNNEGAALEFNSMIHILNHLYRNGWEVMHVKAVDGYESFIMRRKDSYRLPLSGSGK
ncbi:MAG: hypothetical protein AAFP19_01565 [Bacteroidota bacterium]